MCTLHIIDEARHIAHARNALDLSLQNSGRLGKVLLTPLINLLIEQFVRTFYLPKAEVYELAGLTPGKRWRDLARANPTRQAFISQCINPTLNLLQRHGFKVKSPIL